MDRKSFFPFSKPDFEALSRRCFLGSIIEFLVGPEFGHVAPFTLESEVGPACGEIGVMRQRVLRYAESFCLTFQMAKPINATVTI